MVIPASQPVRSHVDGLPPPPDAAPVHLAAPGPAHRATEAGRRARRLGTAVFAVVASGGALVVFAVLGVVGAGRRLRAPAAEDGPDGWRRPGQLPAVAGTR